MDSNNDESKSELSLLRDELELIKSISSRNERDLKLARFMSDLEGRFQIPLFRDQEWESEHPEEFKLYREASFSRVLS